MLTILILVPRAVCEVPPHVNFKNGTKHKHTSSYFRSDVHDLSLIRRKLHAARPAYLPPVRDGFTRRNLFAAVCMCAPLLVSQVLQERVGVLLPLAGIHIGQLLHLAANKIPELLNAVLHPPPQLLLSGPGACSNEWVGGVKENSSLQSITEVLSWYDKSRHR